MKLREERGRARPGRCGAMPRRYRRSAVAMVLLPCAAQAQLDFEPYVGLRYQYNSNVFEEASDEEALEQRGTSERADTALESLVGLLLRFPFGRQQLRLEAEGRRYEYERFGDVDHDEYRLLGALDWTAGDAADGDLFYRAERRLASFADLDTSELRLQTERYAGAGANLDVTPRWRLESGAQLHWLELPLRDYPEFELEETKLDLSVLYAGFGNFASGIHFAYIDGEYSGVPDATAFDELTAQWTGRYKSGLSAFEASAGVSRRQEDVGDEETTGMTGALAFEHSISPKTSFELELFRRISSYSAGANSLLETGFRGGLRWQVTPKTGLLASALWTRSDFEGDSSVAAEDRKDELGALRLDARWDALRWLALSLFGEYRDRQSSEPRQGFDAAILGIELRAAF